MEADGEHASKKISQTTTAFSCTKIVTTKRSRTRGCHFLYGSRWAIHSLQASLDCQMSVRVRVDSMARLSCLGYLDILAKMSRVIQGGSIRIIDENGSFESEYPMVDSTLLMHSKYYHQRRDRARGNNIHGCPSRRMAYSDNFVRCDSS